MDKMNKKVLIVIGVVVAIILGLVALSMFSNRAEVNQTENEVRTLPLTIDDIESNFKIEENILSWEYENNTNQVITKCDIEIMVEGTEEILELQSVESVYPGFISGLVEVEVGYIEVEDLDGDDLEIIKYKIVLRDGTYLEYDAIEKTYNWS